MKGFLAGLLAVVGLSSNALGQANGPEFRVNSYTTADQWEPRVAADPQGNFVVVWADVAHNSGDIFGQIYDATGKPRGATFQVNSYTTGAQAYPDVVWTPNQTFIVVWDSEGQDGSSTGIYERVFSRFGVGSGPDMQVNTYTTGIQSRPSIATGFGGQFVVTWEGAGPGDTFGVFAKRLNTFAIPEPMEFRVNTYTSSYQSAPRAVASASQFMVVWRAYQDGSATGLRAQRYNASGIAQGGEFQVNAYTTGYQQNQAAVADADGNFLVVWAGNGAGVSVSGGIFGRRFDSAGTPLGGDFLVNSYTTGLKSHPAVALEGTSDFVVTWDGEASGGYSEIVGRRVSLSGVPTGSEFQVNTYATGNQKYPTLATAPDGDFVVAWQSLLQDGSGYGVYAQRFGDLIFQDDFEFGLTRWSSSSTDGLDLTATGAAAMGGTATGLQAVVNDTNPLYVQDDTPAAENRYRARFYIDPNGFDPGEALSHHRIRVLIGFDGASRRAFAIVLKRQAAIYSLEGRVRRNDGTRADTGFIDVTNAPHYVELDWQRASGPSSADGSFELWIDGVSRAVLSGIANDTSAIESARLGATSVKAGATGTLYFDQFESRRVSYLGPD